MTRCWNSAYLPSPSCIMYDSARRHNRSATHLERIIIALASATGEKKKKKKKKKAWAKEGPKAPTQARSTEEEAEGLRRLGRTQAPPEKSFRRKLKNLPALLYTIM